METAKDTLRWNWTSWLWVFLCAAGIFATVPLARSIQKSIYNTVGKEFFTYIVLFIICAILVTLLYFFIFKLRVNKISQYSWLVICAGLYVYFTIQLRKHPEEAIHLVEYGLLSFFVYKALSHKIRDWTVYITTVFIILFAGITDEFIQWMMPSRYWGLKDVWINMLAGLIFVLAMWKGIVPQKICGRVRNTSVRMLAGMITINLIVLGLCLSNTPDSVKRYTGVFNSLSWLQSEEPMTEYGYEHNDSEIGSFFSRLTLEEIKRIDKTGGNFHDSKLPEDISSKSVLKELLKTYNPYTNKFIYEFLIRVSRRDDKFAQFMETNKEESNLAAFKENQILEKYYGNTLRNSSYKWPNEKIEALEKTISLGDEDFTSKAGNMITSFSLQTIWIVIFALITIVWTLGNQWEKRLNAD